MKRTELIECIQQAFEWDGKWWADALEGNERAAYDGLVAKLLAASHDELPNIARELFQIGHAHGYDLCTELSREG